MRSLWNVLWPSLIAAVILSATLSVAGAEPVDEVAQLQETVAELEEKVEALQQQNQELGRQRDAAIVVAGMNWSHPYRTPEYKRKVGLAIVDTAKDLGVHPTTIMGIVRVESNFRHSARGAQGEVGITQVMPYRSRPMKRIKADVGFAIRWAIANCFLPDGHKSIEAGLAKYNNNYRPYIRKVMKQIRGYQGLWEVWH